MMKLPNSYIVWDLETTGLDPKESHIIEIGAMLVDGGEVIDRRQWLLNHDIAISEKTTELTGITKEMLDEEGRDPEECLSEFMEILTPGTPHLTHNGMRFDIPFLAHHLAKTFKKTVGEHREITDWLEKYAIDTAVFVKAEKLEKEWYWGETFKEFSDRVMNIIAKGVKYNVALCCEERGIETADQTMHRAGGDVELTHRIYQSIRKS